MILAAIRGLIHGVAYATEQASPRGGAVDAPGPSETIEAYYRRMDPCLADQARADEEFVERSYRHPLGQPRLGPEWDLDALAEKEGHGDH